MSGVRKKRSQGQSRFHVAQFEKSRKGEEEGSGYFAFWRIQGLIGNI